MLLDEWAQHTVMCRICEESVPTSHLESHSYVCAYANECDLEGLTIDERLHKIADMLEQIVEACSQSFDQLSGQSVDSSVKLGHESPQMQEWHNKGSSDLNFFGKLTYCYMLIVHEIATAGNLIYGSFQYTFNMMSKIQMKHFLKFF